jgi:hypothetical protein
MSLRGAKRRGNPVGKYMISLDRRASLRSARDDRTEFPDVPLIDCDEKRLQHYYKINFFSYFIKF